MLVDDDPRNLDVLEGVLESPEYNLVRALTAEGALKLLLDGDFAAIVLDIRLPEMSGLELAHLIKQRKRTRHIPIIFLTAYFQEDTDVLKGYDTGAVDYLTKPINPQILKSKIAVFVDLYRMTRALAAMNNALELEIAHRHQAEEAMRRANNELETRVRSRTDDLLRVNLELRESEAQLRLVTDHAPVLLVQCDRRHCIKFVNRTFAERFGFEPDQSIGLHFSKVIGEAAYAAFQRSFDAALEGRRVEIEAEISDAALGPRWMHVIHEPERAPGGGVVGLVAVISDVTERKLAEREVAMARDKALAGSRAKDDFLARLSHELRTPLNPVLLLASDAANDPELPEAVRAVFATITKNVTLEARLIDDLLDLTSITHGKVALELRRFDVQVSLHDALAMVGPEIAQKRIELALELKADRHTVLGDDVRLKQIFWNVLKNAVKFTPEAGRITVETAVIRESGKLEVRITDTGIGMTPEEIARIFELFSQGDHGHGSGANRFGGLGLGLAISRMLVEQHSGLIRAASAGRNQGSTFTIELPLLQLGENSETGPASGKPALPPAPLPAAAGAGRSRRVLLVEDHQPTRSALIQLLNRRHFDVIGAESLSQARAIAAREAFELLISDIGLPDGNGCDLMSELRHRRGLIGIALTGYGMDEDVGRSQAAGFAAHLTKPVSVQALDRALAAAVSR